MGKESVTEEILSEWSNGTWTWAELSAIVADALEDAGVPAETVMVEFERGGYDMGGHIKIFFTRQETDEEEAARQISDAHRESEARAREYRSYLALKKKYEPTRVD